MKTTIKNSKMTWLVLGTAGTWLLLLAALPAQQPGNDKKDPFVKNVASAEKAAVDEGEEDDDSEIYNIVVQLEYIDVPRVKLVDYAIDPGIDTDATPLRQRVQEWIEAGEASVFETSLLATRSGQPGKVESLGLLTYATSWRAESGFPAIWGKRAFGSVVEIDPVYSLNDGSIDLRVAAEIVKHAGESPASPKPSWFQQGDTYMPLFQTMQFSTSVTCIPDHYMLLGTQPPFNGANDRSILAFVRCGRSYVRPNKATDVANQQSVTIEHIEVLSEDYDRWAYTQTVGEIPLTARETAGKWVSSDRARNVGFAVIQGRSGQKLRASSIVELTFAKDHHWSDVGQAVGSGGVNTGATVDMITVFGVGGICDLNVTPEITAFVGTNVTHRDKGKPDCVHPIFHTMKTTSQQTLKVGETRLWSTMTPPGDNGQPDFKHKVLMFVTVRR
ncbi:MAG: hypothetical protein KDN22_26625 [Verrucomicrobiae bacterium]|nr:hypothetical protein [Verrucomicrobiae bacterium]